jgi:hypothetical protein
MHTPYENIRITRTCSVATNGVTVYVNTTDMLTALTSGATVGPQRGQFLNWRLVWTLLVTDLNITLSARKLINGAWAQVTSADFPVALTAGDVTITANAAPQQTMSWLLPWDAELYATNGGTGPTIHSIDMYLTNNPNPGV